MLNEALPLYELMVHVLVIRMLIDGVLVKRVHGQSQVVRK